MERDDAVTQWLTDERDWYDDETKHFNDFPSPYWLLDALIDDYLAKTEG